MDLTTGWDLGNPAHQRRAEKLIDQEDPLFILAAPPCRMFSSLQNLSKSTRDQIKYDKNLAEAQTYPLPIPHTPYPIPLSPYP